MLEWDSRPLVPYMARVLKMGFEALWCARIVVRGIMGVLELWYKALWVCSNRGSRLLVT